MLSVPLDNDPSALTTPKAMGRRLVSASSPSCPSRPGGPGGPAGPAGACRPRVAGLSLVSLRLHVSPLRTKTAPDFLVQSTVASAEGGMVRGPRLLLLRQWLLSSHPPFRPYGRATSSCSRGCVSSDPSASTDGGGMGHVSRLPPRRMVNNLPPALSHPLARRGRRARIPAALACNTLRAELF